MRACVCFCLCVCMDVCKHTLPKMIFRQCRVEVVVMMNEIMLLMF